MYQQRHGRLHNGALRYLYARMLLETGTFLGLMGKSSRELFSAKLAMHSVLLFRARISFRFGPKINCIEARIKLWMLSAPYKDALGAVV